MDDSQSELNEGSHLRELLNNEDNHLPTLFSVKFITIKEWLYCFQTLFLLHKNTSHFTIVDCRPIYLVFVIELLF